MKKGLKAEHHISHNNNVKTCLVTSGNHCAVRLGHSRACVITKSYKNGVFFFQILYSSFITLSSTASSKPLKEIQLHNLSSANTNNTFNKSFPIDLEISAVRSTDCFML